MSPSCCLRLPEKARFPMLCFIPLCSWILRHCFHVVYFWLSKPPKHSTYSSSLNDSTMRVSDLGGKNRWNCFLKNITSSTQTIFSHSFFLLKNNIWIPFKKRQQRSSADYQSPEQHMRFWSFMDFRYNVCTRENENVLQKWNIDLE